MESAQIRDRRVAANGAELAKHFKTKGFSGLRFEDANDVLRALAALAFGKLTGGWAGLTILCVYYPGAIADGPKIGCAFDAQIRFGQEPPLFLWKIEHGKDGG